MEDYPSRKRGRSEDIDIEGLFTGVSASASVTGGPKKRRRVKRGCKKRSLSIKSRLLAKLRSRRKVYRAKLRAVDRDIRSLTHRRKSSQQ